MRPLQTDVLCAADPGHRSRGGGSGCHSTTARGRAVVDAPVALGRCCGAPPWPPDPLSLPQRPWPSPATRCLCVASKALGVPLRSVGVSLGPGRLITAPSSVPGGVGSMELSFVHTVLCPGPPPCGRFSVRQAPSCGQAHVGAQASLGCSPPCVGLLPHLDQPPLSPWRSATTPSSVWPLRFGMALRPDLRRGGKGRRMQTPPPPGACPHHNTHSACVHTQAQMHAHKLRRTHAHQGLGGRGVIYRPGKPQPTHSSGKQGNLL